MKKIKVINNESKKIRADKFLVNSLKEEYNFSRNFIQKLFENNSVFINNKNIFQSDNVFPNQELEILIPDPKVTDIIPENIAFDIVYEDDNLLIVNKPNGMVVHPAPGNENNTLVNGLLYKVKNLSSIGGIIRPGIVHRIDKLTTGLLIVAKNDKTHRELVKMLQNGEIKKTYLGIVRGEVIESKGKIDAPIGRSINDRKKMMVTNKNSKNAVTNFEVIKRLKEFTLMKFNIETGRTHQIRVHCNFIKHPILGDPLYGLKSDQKESFGQYLHSYQLEFIHPITNKNILINCEPPKEFVDKIKELEQ